MCRKIYSKRYRTGSAVSALPTLYAPVRGFTVYGDGVITTDYVVRRIEQICFAVLW